MAREPQGLATETELGQRFKLVDFIPALVVATILALVIAWDRFLSVSFDATPWWWSVGLIGGAALVVALVLRPFQVALVRLLEGYWPSSRLTHILFEMGVELQSARKASLHRIASGGASQPATRISMERMSWAREQLRRFPQEDRLLPTALGNTLRAAEHLAGERYGMDVSWALPRMWGIIDEPLRREYEELVDQYDSSARLAVSLFFAVVLATGIVTITRGPFGLLLSAGLALAWLSYKGAIQSAALAGELLVTIVDIHRFDVLERLRVALPASPAKERRLNSQLTQFFNLEHPEPFPVRRYVHRTSQRS